MLRGQNQGGHARDDFIGHSGFPQDARRPGSTLRFVIRSVRIIDHIVTPQGEFDLVGESGQMTDEIELSQTVANVIERVIGAMRLPIGQEQLIENSRAWRWNFQSAP